MANQRTAPNQRTTPNHVRRIRHIIWDWNGTLLDDAGACAAAVDALKRRRGLGGETVDGYRGRIRFPVREYYRLSGFDLEREDYGVLCDEFGEAYGEAAEGRIPADSAHVVPTTAGIHADVQSVLEEAQAAGVSHAIVSASEAGALRYQVERYGLMGHFRALVGRDDNHGGTKDHLVADWVARCGFHRDEILYVGDTEHDWESAAAAGIRMALVSDGHVTETRLRALGVPVYADRASLWRDVAVLAARPVYRSLTVETPIGRIDAVTDNLGLFRLVLPGADPFVPPAGAIAEGPDQRTRAAAAALAAWFDNPAAVTPEWLVARGVPLSVTGTAFQRLVWQAVCQVEPGRTVGYGDLALRIGRPGAARAVAGALRANPVPVLVPCHRVVGADGTPTGFMGRRGNPLQASLLACELRAMQAAEIR